MIMLFGLSEKQESLMAENMAHWHDNAVWVE
jgi:hypothetical protein